MTEEEEVCSVCGKKKEEHCTFTSNPKDKEKEKKEPVQMDLFW